MDYFDNLAELEKADIRRKIDEGITDIRLGRVSDGEEFMDPLIAELDDEIRVEEEARRHRLFYLRQQAYCPKRALSSMRPSLRARHPPSAR